MAWKTGIIHIRNMDDMWNKKRVAQDYRFIAMMSVY